MPFYELSDDELIKLSPRHLIHFSAQLCQIQKSSEQITVLESENSILKAEIDQLRKENEEVNAKLKAVNQNLIKENEVLRNKVLSVENKMKISMGNVRRECGIKIEEKNEEIVALKANHAEKYEDLESDMSILKEICNSTIKEVEEQRNKLFHLCLKLEDLEGEAITKFKAVSEEFQSVTSQFYGNSSAAHPTRQKPCRNCGSSNGHHPAHCLAKGNRCQNCDKLNHFTAVCKAPTIPDGADEAEIQLMEAIRTDLGL